MDTVNWQALGGWAWDASRPDCPINLDVYNGSTKEATVAADLFRQNLLNAGIGNGYHAFGWTIPASLNDGSYHTINFYIGGTKTALNWSRATMIGNAPILPSQSPNVTQSGTAEVGSSFTSTMTEVIAALRFYKAAGETRSHTVKLWSSSGMLLTSVTIPASSSSGWKEGSLSTPYQITKNTTYVAGYNVNAELDKYNCSPAYPFTNGPLTATAGYYNLTVGAFPNV